MNLTPFYRVAELNIYPIKSIQGLSLPEVELTSRGFAADRRWMVTTPTHHCITARDCPTLTQVVATLDGRQLRLRAPGMPELNLTPPDHRSGRELAVEIWGQQVTACYGGSSAANWFSTYLRQDCQLVYLAQNQHRSVDPNYARTEDEVSFADGFPVLLMTQASLQDLNARLKNRVSMRRFRPNLVVSGTAPYREDSWHRIRIGETEFECAKACPRCIFTTLDPTTATFDPRQEPLRTLGSYRRDPAGGVNFGQNLLPRKLGRIRLGDRVEPL